MQARTIGQILPITVLAVAALLAACSNNAAGTIDIASFNCTAIDTVARPDSNSPHLIIIKCDIGLSSPGGEPKDAPAPAPKSINDTISSPWPQS